MGIVNEWGVFLRDRAVAAEPTLALDGFRAIPSSRMQRVLGKSHASEEEQVCEAFHSHNGDIALKLYLDLNS
jgi:hypothetical protein